MRMISLLVDNGATLTYTVEPNWATNPTNGDALVAVDTIKPKTGDPTSYLTFRFCQDGGGSDLHKFTLTGCIGSFKITTNTDSIPFAEFSYSVDSWVSAETSLDAVVADTFASPKPMLGSPVYIDNTQTDTESFGFDPGVKHAPVVSTYGTNGRVGWLTVGNEPKPQIKPYWDVDFLTKQSAGTLFGLGVESIKDSNEGWFFYAHKCQIMKTGVGDIQGIQSSEIDIGITDPGTGTDNSVATYIPQWVIGITGDGT
jgi:hypothetical protein